MICPAPMPSNKMIGTQRTLLPPTRSNSRKFPNRHMVGPIQTAIYIRITGRYHHTAAREDGLATCAWIHPRPQVVKTPNHYMRKRDPHHDTGPLPQAHSEPDIAEPVRETSATFAEPPAYWPRKYLVCCLRARTFCARNTFIFRFYPSKVIS